MINHLSPCARSVEMSEPDFLREILESVLELMKKRLILVQNRP